MENTNKYSLPENITDLLMQFFTDPKIVKKLQDILNTNDTKTILTTLEDRIVNNNIILPNEGQIYTSMTASEVASALGGDTVNVFKLGRALAKLKNVPRQVTNGTNRYGILKVIPLNETIVEEKQPTEKPIKVKKNKSKKKKSKNKIAKTIQKRNKKDV